MTGTTGEGRLGDENPILPRIRPFMLWRAVQGKRPDIPFVDPASVKRAKREDEAASKQGTLI